MPRDDLALAGAGLIARSAVPPSAVSSLRPGPEKPRNSGDCRNLPSLEAWRLRMCILGEARIAYSSGMHPQPQSNVRLS